MHSKIESIVAPLVESLGYIFWGLELIMGGQKPTLRLFVETDSGINIDQCGEVSREVGAALDVANVPEGEYTLEVSSPGIDRILFSLAQCKKYIGDEVTVALTTSIEGRRRYKGILCEVQDDAVLIGEGNAQLRIPFHKVKRMRIVPQFD